MQAYRLSCCVRAVETLEHISIAFLLELERKRDILLLARAICAHWKHMRGQVAVHRVLVGRFNSFISFPSAQRSAPLQLSHAQARKRARDTNRA